MPKYEGVYQDGRGGWYFKATLGRDPLSGKRVQVTKRGFPTAHDASRARREMLEGGSRPVAAMSPMTVDELLDLYLDELEADRRLSAKTRYDYRSYAQLYVRPLLGRTKVRSLSPEVVLAWQRRLIKSGKAANTIRLARAPLSGALKLPPDDAVEDAGQTVGSSWTAEVDRSWPSAQQRDLDVGQRRRTQGGR